MSEESVSRVMILAVYIRNLSRNLCNSSKWIEDRIDALISEQTGTSKTDDVKLGVKVAFEAAKKDLCNIEAVLKELKIIDQEE